jgi:hypothetical protein
LPRYQHLGVLLRIDQVAVVVFTDLEFDPVDLAGELAALHVALGSNRGPCFVADVEAFVGREDERLGGTHAAFADLLAVVVEGDSAALGVAAAVVGELDADLVGAGRDGLDGLGGEGLDPEQVVGELGPAVPGVEAPATDGATLGDDRPVQGPSGATTSAVTENDLFLMFRTLFSDSRIISG